MRLPAGIRKFLIAVLNRSPLVKNVAAFLKPHYEVLKSEPSSEYHLCATGPDPQFLCNNPLIAPGWYMVEVSVRTDQSGACAMIYFDVGDGFFESLSFTFPLKRGRLTKRLVRVPRGLRRIRFDPINSEGEFTIERLRFAWGPWRFAKKRIFQRLVNLHPGYRGLGVETVPARLRQLEKVRSRSGFIAALEQHYEKTFRRTNAAIDYQEWLQFNPVMTNEQRDAALQTCCNAPLISVLMPVYNPPLAFLREAIESVIDQSYQNWELCIADDASTDPEVKATLDNYAKQDDRINVVYRPKNGHISAASNSALSVVNGEYLALLDHDDLLDPDALLSVVRCLHDHPEALLVYSDEDKADEYGQRFDPHFKTDWNPELILGQNYISHLGVYQTQRVRDIGGFREGYEGSQDHDLVLRFTRGLAPEQIIHIPKVLYHWRAIAGSTAMETSQKSYTSSAGMAAVEDRLAQCDGYKVVSGPVPNTYRVLYPLPEVLPKVTLLVPTRDGVDILKPCMMALLERTDYSNFEILILDNQTSCSRTLEYFSEVQADPRVRVLRWDFPFNYSAINNFGFQHATGDIIGLINNDIEPINEGWLKEMVRHVIRPEVGCVGAKLYYPNDTIQHAGVVLGIGGVAGHSHKYYSRHHDGYFSRLRLVQNVSAVTGACLLVRSEVFSMVGGLDDKNLSVAFNDVDFCLKVREAGLVNIWTPYAEAYHHESVSRGADDTPEKRDRHNREADYMKLRWSEELLNDPYYNPNLTLIHEDFSLKPV